ncbi:hypothetical protein PR048_011038 [Dryococelus australis]|uniref:Uncharacterized protein n=1 Tax=Dryococelus australis TaxID=614101 RepID=A0ABQ9HKS6_9NEOP|nr:hypothetical protein PR048_011038 [Dryococelus australis]
MTYERDLFMNITPLSNRSVILGDGCSLNNVLWLPGLKLNLFSLSSAIEKSHVVNMSAGDCYVYKDNEVCAVANEGNLYILDFIMEHNSLAVVCSLESGVKA